MRGGYNMQDGCLLNRSHCGRMKKMTSDFDWSSFSCVHFCLFQSGCWGMNEEDDEKESVDDSMVSLLTGIKMRK